MTRCGHRTLSIALVVLCVAVLVTGTKVAGGAFLNLASVKLTKSVGDRSQEITGADRTTLLNRANIDRLLGKAVHLDRESLAVRRFQGRLALLDGNFEEAAVHLSVVHEAHPEYTWATWQLAETFYQLQRPDLSLLLFERLGDLRTRREEYIRTRLNQERIFAPVLRIRECLDQQDYDCALRESQEALTLDPDNWALLLLRYETLSRLDKREARNDLESIVQTPGWHADSRLLRYVLPVIQLAIERKIWSVEFLENLLDNLAWQGDATDLTWAVDWLLSEYPDNASVHTTTGRILERAEMLDAAGYHYQIALRLTRDQEQLHCNLPTRVRCLEEVATEVNPDKSVQTYRDCLEREFARVNAVSISALIAQAMQVAPQDIHFGENLIINGDFNNPLTRRRWYWDAWPKPEPSQDGAFLGGRDAVIGSPTSSSLRISSLWNRREGRAGFWYFTGNEQQSRIVLKRNHCYCLSFYYMTQSLATSSGKMGIFLLGGREPVPFFAGGRRLPLSEGQWGYVVVLGCNLGDVDVTITPLFDSTVVGTVWIDQIMLREISLPADKREWGLWVAGSP